VELDLNPEIVQNIINLTLEFNEQDDVTPLEDAEEPDIDDADFSEVMVDRFGTDPYYQQLKTAIEDLEPDQQISLVALMWVGRGDYSVREWDEAIEHAQDSWTPNTADYLIGTPLLADYLTEGLEQVDNSED